MYQFVFGWVYFVMLAINAKAMSAALAGNILLIATFFNTDLMGYVFWNQWQWMNSLPENN